MVIDTPATKMDKLTVATALLLILTDALAVLSLSTPDWIVTNFAGTTKLGLTKMCITFRGQSEICTKPHLPSEWLATLVFIVTGITLISMSLCLIVFAIWNEALMKGARWFAFVGVMLLCMSALIFPFGFHIPEIGGEAYKLPPNTEVGYSYYLFFTAVFFSAMSCSLSNLYVLHFNIL